MPQRERYNYKLCARHRSVTSGHPAVVVYHFADIYIARFPSSSSAAGTARQRQTATGDELLLLKPCLKKYA